MVLLRLLLLFVYVILVRCSDSGTKAVHFDVGGYYSKLNYAISKAENYYNLGRVGTARKALDRARDIKNVFDQSFSKSILSSE